MEVDLEGFSLTWPDLTSPVFIPQHFRGEVRNEKERNLKENSIISKEHYSNKRATPSYCQTKAKATYNSFELFSSYTIKQVALLFFHYICALKKLAKVLRSKKKMKEVIFLKTTRTAEISGKRSFYTNQPQNHQTSEHLNDEITD